MPDIIPGAGRTLAAFAALAIGCTAIAQVPPSGQSDNPQSTDPADPTSGSSAAGASSSSDGAMGSTPSTPATSEASARAAFQAGGATDIQNVRRSGTGWIASGMQNGKRVQLKMGEDGRVVGEPMPR